MGDNGKRLPLGDDELGGWRLEGLDFPSFRLSLMAKIMDRLTIRELSARSQISIAEWRVLSRLAMSEDGLTVWQIASKAWVDRAEVSRAARALEDRGYISRRENPSDRRAPILFVTQEGKAAFAPVMAFRTEFHARVMDSFTQQEIEQLDALLEKMALNVLSMINESAIGN